jgi:Leucine-rich repeat (LRR) protein
MWVSSRVLQLCLIAGIMVAGCAKAQPKNAEEELRAYAARTGGEWVSEIGSLQGKKASLLTELKSLSPAALARIQMVQVSAPDLEVAPDLGLLTSLRYLDLSGGRLHDIRALAGLKISRLILSDSPLSDIRALASCPNLVMIGLDNTKVEAIPDLSALAKITMVSLSSTPLRSLSNIETIRSDFDLSVMRCNGLTDIAALRLARVRTLFIDEKNYARLKPWLNAHIQEIKKKNPKFNIQFSITE